MRTLGPDPWLPYVRPSGRCRRRLFCFPYAGGSASTYLNWADALPAGVELCAVQLPGRGERRAEPSYDRLEALVERLVEVLAPYLTVPFAFFGHSMGGVVSFELARSLRRLGLRQPAGLFVSARRAPGCPAREPPLHDLPDDEFVAEVRRLNGTPDELLRNPDLMKLVMPSLRADFAICETHVHLPEAPLGCPIHVFGGDSDPYVDRADLMGWREHTDAACTVRVFAGDHFFIHTAHREVLDTVHDYLVRLPMS
jgi:medium-chain acyl-[acyl-carrier-protein] hydrolase